MYSVASNKPNIKSPSCCTPRRKKDGQATQKMGYSTISGFCKVLRKLALIFLGLVISLFLTPQVGSVKPLVVSPSSLSFAIPPGGVDTYYLEVLNLDNFSISVKSDFDSGWMFLSPSEFKFPPGEAKRILAVFFIPEAEDPQRDGEILFRSEDENKQAPVKVAISAPMAKEEKLYQAWIEVEYKDSYLKIRAFCLNNTSEDEVLRYELEARKSGKSGTAKTFQAGSVLIPTQEKKCLSQSGLSVSPTDHYQIKLEVYEDGKLVAEDSVFYPPIRSL